MKTLFMEFWSFVGWITLYLFICHTVWVNSDVQSNPETSQVPLKYICECDTKANRFSCNCALYSWNLTCKAVVLNVWTLNNHGNCLQHTPLTIKCAKNEGCIPRSSCNHRLFQFFDRLVRQSWCSTIIHSAFLTWFIKSVYTHVLYRCRMTLTRRVVSG